MTEFIYLLLLLISFGLGWKHGLAGYESTRWLAAPAFTFMIGAMVRFFWMKP